MSLKSNDNGNAVFARLVNTTKEIMQMKEFQTITFSPGEKHYHSASFEDDYDFLSEDQYIKHIDMTIPLGKSRYGGHIIDLPEGFDRPDDMRFAAQLDLKEISKADKKSRLPKTGQLIFFADIAQDKCVVVYVDNPNEKLHRVIDEHDDNFFSGVLI